MNPRTGTKGSRNETASGATGRGVGAGDGVSGDPDQRSDGAVALVSQVLGAERPRLLDLFCGAGGAGMGYHRAGFDVTGVDIKPQKNYPFTFYQAEVFQFTEDWDYFTDFDAVHASPPCQDYSRALRHQAGGYPRLI